MECLFKFMAYLSFFSLVSGLAVLGAQMLYFEAHFMQEFLHSELAMLSLINEPAVSSRRIWLAAVRSCHVCQLPYACLAFGLLLFFFVPR